MSKILPYLEIILSYCYHAQKDCDRMETREYDEIFCTNKTHYLCCCHCHSHAVTPSYFLSGWMRGEKNGRDCVLGGKGKWRIWKTAGNKNATFKKKKERDKSSL